MNEYIYLVFKLKFMANKIEEPTHGANCQKCDCFLNGACRKGYVGICNHGVEGYYVKSDTYSGIKEEVLKDIKGF